MEMKNENSSAPVMKLLPAGDMPFNRLVTIPFGIKSIGDLQNKNCGIMLSALSI